MIELLVARLYVTGHGPSLQPTGTPQGGRVAPHVEKQCWWDASRNDLITGDAQRGSIDGGAAFPTSQLPNSRQRLARGDVGEHGLHWHATASTHSAVRAYRCQRQNVSHPCHPPTPGGLSARPARPLSEHGKTVIGLPGRSQDS